MTGSEKAALTFAIVGYGWLTYFAISDMSISPQPFYVKAWALISLCVLCLLLFPFLGFLFWVFDRKIIPFLNKHL